MTDTPASIARLKAYVDARCFVPRDLTLSDLRAALGEIERLRAQIIPLAHIVDSALEIAGEGGDFDGGNIQEQAIALGLIVARDMTPEEAAEHGYDDGSSWMDETPLCKAALFCVRGWPLPAHPVTP